MIDTHALNLGGMPAYQAALAGLGERFAVLEARIAQLDADMRDLDAVVADLLSEPDDDTDPDTNLPY